MSDLYRVLGVRPDASMAEIKAAYRFKAAKLHPDKGGNADAFRKVAEAYRVLSDPQSRARYDRTGDTSAGPDITTTAMALLANWLRQIVDGPLDLKHNDIVKLMKDQVAKERSAVSENHGKAKKALHRVNHVKKNLTRNGDGAPAFLVNVLDERRKEIAQNLRQLERGKATLAKVEELLADCSYSHDHPVDRGGPWASFSWSATTGGTNES
jgi:curved DNA-binding protein CbpA